MVRLLRRLLAGVRALFHRAEVERDLDEELRAYLDAAVERHMQAGLGREAATRAARLELGSLAAVKDHVRDSGWESRLDDLWRDARCALRTLRRSPAFTAVAVLTLALGIGANTAIFSVINSLMLRTLPVVEPRSLVTVSSTASLNQGFNAGWSYPFWEQFRQRRELFDGAMAWSGSGPSLRFNLALRGETQPVSGVFVSGDFFSTLGVPALLGRTLTSVDDARGRGTAAVISYGLWQRRFGGAADVIGREMVIERVPFTIVGVTPSDFFGVEVGRSFDVAVPLAAEPLMHPRETWLNADGPAFLTVMLRLKPEQSIDAATSALRAVQPQIASAIPAEMAQFRQDFVADPLLLVPAAFGISELRQFYERPLLTIFGVVAVVLLIACVNIANLLLGRATARDHELSVRRALGASRWRLARQVLVECLLVACLGSLAGLLLAAWAGQALVARVLLFGSPVVMDLPFDWRVLAFTGISAVLTTVVVGTAPAIRATRTTALDALQERADRSASDRRRVSGTLVMTQVALSLVLVIAAGLLIRSFDRLASRPLGFESDRLLVANVDASRVAVGAARLPLYQRIVDTVGAVPGVVHAAGSLMTPIGFGLVIVTVVDVPGAPPMDDREPLPTYSVTPGWFDSYRTSIREGRDIDRRDTATSQSVVLVNEAFVRRFFPSGNAVGGTVTPRTVVPGQKRQPLTVIDVVADAVLASPREVVMPTMYRPLAQWDAAIPPPELSISVRPSTGSPALVAGGVAAAIALVDPDLSFSFRPLGDHVSASIHQERLLALLSAFFGALAILLAAIGLFGVTSYAVARRRTEIGIRMALGAQRGDILRFALGQTILATSGGVVVGLASAAAVTRYLEALLFEITPLDAFTFIAAPAILAAVALIACYLPARRATSIDPMVALRCE